MIEHKIVLNSDVPVRSKPYPVPLHLMKELDKELDTMLEANIIEPSQAFYASPMVILKKPSGELRICINYKNLNKISYFDPEGMLNADDIFDRIGASKCYSKFDLCKGYYQIKLDENSKDYSSFTTHRGLFRFNVMSFGLSSASSTFNRMMRKLLNKTENLDSYIDDVLCHTQDWNTHLSSLETFFTRVREANIKLKPSKCEIGFNSIDFLGHRIIEDSRTPNPTNLGKIIEAARPQTKKQIMSFLGVVGFYRSYVKNFSKLSIPLTDLLKRSLPNKVKWEEKHEQSFQALKNCLLSEPILKLPRIDKPFILQTDASNRAVGVALLQEYEGILHPISFASRKLCDRETRWSISERECLAVIFGIQKFH